MRAVAIRRAWDALVDGRAGTFVGVTDLQLPVSAAWGAWLITCTPGIADEASSQRQSNRNLRDRIALLFPAGLIYVPRSPVISGLLCILPPSVTSRHSGEKQVGHVRSRRKRPADSVSHVCIRTQDPRHQPPHGDGEGSEAT